VLRIVCLEIYRFIKINSRNYIGARLIFGDFLACLLFTFIYGFYYMAPSSLR
jgi:hypothetical protein